MIGLSTQTKDEMLANTFASRTFMVALYQGDSEIQDALYNRRSVRFSDPIGEGDVRYVQNVEIIRFEGFNNRHVVDHWAVVDEAGEVKGRWRVVEPREVGPVMDCKFRPGELRIGLP